MIHKISKENTARQESKIIEKTFDNLNEGSDLNCPKCNLSTNIGETINCNNCNKWYHYTCVNITSNDPWVQYEEIPYYCSKCEAQRNIESSNLSNITKVPESQVECSNCIKNQVACKECFIKSIIDGIIDNLPFQNNSELKKTNETSITEAITETSMSDVKNSKSNEQFRCPNCDEDFSRILDLEIHMKIKGNGNSNTKSKCKQCFFESCTLIGITKHMMKSHNGSFDLKCLNDESSGNKKKQFKCSNCDQKFFNKSELEVHMKTKDNLAKCSHCFFKSCTRIGLARHVKAAHDNFDETSEIQSNQIAPTLSRPELTQNFKFTCRRCDFVSDREDRFKKHKELSMGIKMVKSCKFGCSFKSCTFIGLKNHKCLNSQDQQQFESENQTAHDNFAKTSEIQSNPIVPTLSRTPDKSLKSSVHEEKIQSPNNPKKRVHDKQSKNSSISASIIAEPRSKLIKVELNNQLEDTSFSNKTGGKYSQEFKCSRCDVIVQNKERLQRHEDISKAVKNIQTCNECNFRSCSAMGLKSKSHKCSKSMKTIQSQINAKTLSESNGHLNESEIISIKKELNPLIDFQNFSKSPEISVENSKTLINNEKWPELTQKFEFECPRCDVVSDREDRFKKHGELSKGIQTVKSCKHGCSFKSCTFIGLKNHKCSNIQDNNQQQFESENQIINSEDPLALSEKNRNSLDNGIEFQNHMEVVLTSNKPENNPVGVRKEFSLSENIQSKTSEKSLKKYKCQNCDWKFPQLTKLKRHIERSKPFDQPTACSLCNFLSCSAKSLTRHKCLKNQKKIQHQMAPIREPLESSKGNIKSSIKYKCPKCEWKFSFRSNFKRHLERSKGIDMPQKCAICNLSYCTPSGFVGRHKCLKSQEKNNHQMQIEPNKEILTSNEHDKSSKVYRYKCGKCDWKFRDLTRYNRHIERSKKFDNPKKCAVCNFSSCTGLQNHKCLNEIVEKPNQFSCSKCDWKFSLHFHLRRHLERSKGIEKPQKCAICNFSSCTPSGLGRHTGCI